MLSYANASLRLSSKFGRYGAGSPNLSIKGSKNCDKFGKIEGIFERPFKEIKTVKKLITELLFSN